MKEYPTTISPELLERNKAISDEQISIDIADTEREIAQYKSLLEADRITAANHPNDAERKLADFRAGARPGQIAELERFVAFLRLLQEGRRAAT